MSEYQARPAFEAGGHADPISPEASPRSAELRIPLLLFAICLAAQLYLVFFKSFNWDEFLHFSFIYRLKAGSLVQPFQIIHLRFLFWAPEISRDLLDQMLAARMFVWATHLLTLSMIYGVARQFTGRVNAFYAAFAYLSAGYVFLHAFSIRADAMVAATLMSALFLLAKGNLSAHKAIAIGALIGLAGMMTFKTAFYAPCFAGLSWLKFREAPEKSQFLAKLAILAVTAALALAVFYLAHTSGFPKAPKSLGNTSFISFYLRWLTFELPFAGYIGREVLLAPLFFLVIILAPRAWRKVGLNRDAQLALAGFLAPLLVLFFYRNTFPYFFTFILAPVAVAVAPALGSVRDRYGSVFLAVLLAAPALALAALEPRHMIGRQQALIDYVHREWPDKTGYLDYSGMIADYPRVLTYLTSGNGIRLYHEQGDAIVGREIDRGNVPFIIANQEVIQAALEDRPIRRTFLPADLAAMRGNYVKQWGVLWREGREIPAGTGEFVFDLRRGGKFVLAGNSVTLDGVAVAPGAVIMLSKGRHVAKGGRQGTSTLWRGDRLPAAPPEVPMDEVFTNF